MKNRPKSRYGGLRRSSKKCSTVVTKLLKLYYENSIFLLSRDLHIRLLRDAYRVSTWMDFGLKNPPKSALGRLLGRLMAVLGRLGPSWRALETSWRGIKKWCQKRYTKNRQKMRLQASLVDLVGGDPCTGVGGSCPGHGHGFRSGALN